MRKVSSNMIFSDRLYVNYINNTTYIVSGGICPIITLNPSVKIKQCEGANDEDNTHMIEIM